MKITEVEAALMSYPLPEPMLLHFWGGERTIIKRDAMLIRVKADNGLIGYAPGPAHERAANEIRETIRPFLLGKDPRAWSNFDFRPNDPVASLSPSDGERASLPSGVLLTKERVRGDLEITKTYRAVEIA